MAVYPTPQLGGDPMQKPMPAFDPYAMQGGAGGYSMQQWQQLQDWINQNAQDPSQIYAGLGGVKGVGGQKFDYLLNQIHQLMPQQQGGGLPPIKGGGVPPMPPTPGGAQMGMVPPSMYPNAGGVNTYGNLGVPQMAGGLPGQPQGMQAEDQPPVPQPTGQYRDMLMRHRANRQMRRQNRYERRNQGVQRMPGAAGQIEQQMSGGIQPTMPNEQNQMPPYGGGYNVRGRGRYGY